MPELNLKPRKRISFYAKWMIGLSVLLLIGLAVLIWGLLTPTFVSPFAFLAHL